MYVQLSPWSLREQSFFHSSSVQRVLALRGFFPATLTGSFSEFSKEFGSSERERFIAIAEGLFRMKWWETVAVSVVTKGDELPVCCD